MRSISQFVFLVAIFGYAFAAPALAGSNIEAPEQKREDTLIEAIFKEGAVAEEKREDTLIEAIFKEGAVTEE